MKQAQRHETSYSKKQSGWLIGNYRASHLCNAKDSDSVQYDTENY